jgi:HEAT repeat protein
MALVLLLVLLPCFLFSQETFSKNQILYSMHTGDLQNAFELYRAHQKELGHHDLELIQQIGLTLLDQGYRSKDSEIQILTLFGAGISQQEKALYILEEGAKSQNPQMQLISLNYLAKSHHDRAEEALQRALNSDSLLIRLEALLFLAEMHHPRATTHAESLMCKLPTQLLPLFPQIFAAIGNEAAIKALRKLLAHPKEEVRLAAILAVAKFERDDLLPQIRTLATHSEAAQLECCAVALGVLGDESSFQRLETLARHPLSSLRLAAAQALYRLGKKEWQKAIEKEAAEGNIFALAMLGEMSGSEELLARLVKSQQLQIRIQAALSLLELSDARSLPTLTEILIHDSRDLAFEKISTHGSGLTAWRAIPSAKHNLDDSSIELSLALREEVLRKSVDLPEKNFLQIAEALFEIHQNDLIPTLVELLDTLQTEKAKSLLKKYSQKAGAPLCRHFCNLALFKMKEEGPYEELLHHFVVHSQDLELIRFRPSVTLERRDYVAGSPLTPEEKSRLLIAAFETFTRAQSDKGIDALLEAMQNGHAKNRYALAGLLIRTSL